ncbi:transposase DDE domain protein [Escherichia coli 6-319-05_S4_C3]|nr:transposase DDE domain protein [Escherichia coli 6-319-05_S4_C3]
MAKQKFKITNWPTYNKALINRGSITFWLDDEAIQAWYESTTPSSRGMRGDADDFLDCFIIPARIVGGTFWG